MAALATLRLQTRRLLDEEDTTNTHFTDTELNDYLNQGTAFLGVDLEWPIQTSVATTVLSQVLYALPDDFVELTEAYLDNKRLFVCQRDDLSSMGGTTWQDAEDGAPYAIYKADNAVVGLFPPPNADYAALDLQVQYVKVPETMTSDVDIPDLHIAYQVCLPFYAAYMGEGKLGNDKKAALHLQSYTLHKRALMSKVDGFSNDVKRFKWPVY